MALGRMLLAISAGAWLGGCVATATTHAEKREPPPHARHARRGHRPPAPPPAAAQAAPKRDFVGVSTLPPQPKKQAPPRSKLRAAVLPSGVAEGRPAGFEPAAPAAYFIWQGPRGGWRIRTTTAEAPHTFRGHLSTTAGSVSDIQPSRIELGDRIWQTAEGWAFSFRTSGHADGFTFSVPEAGCVVFDLKIDGGPVPKRIFIGRRQLEPGNGHFVACPSGVTYERR